MTFAIGTLSDVTPFDGSVVPQRIFRQIILGAVVAGFGTVAAVWVITASPTANSNINESASVAPKTVVPANPYGALAGAAYSFAMAPVLIDPGSARIVKILD
jgi:hypothetical protein